MTMKSVDKDITENVPNHAAKLRISRLCSARMGSPFCLLTRLLAVEIFNAPEGILAVDPRKNAVPPSAKVTICKEPFGQLLADIPSLSGPIISGTLKPMHTCIWGNFRQFGFISVFRPWPSSIGSPTNKSRSIEIGNEHCLSNWQTYRGGLHRRGLRTCTH